AGLAEALGGKDGGAAAGGGADQGADRGDADDGVPPGPARRALDRSQRSRFRRAVLRFARHPVSLLTGRFAARGRPRTAWPQKILMRPNCLARPARRAPWLP